MNLLHVLAVLLALVGVVPAITLASPVKVVHRAVPAIMVCVSLALWFVPTGIDVALACVPVAAWISARLGIEHAGHEPASYSKAVELARKTTQAARDRIKPPAPVEIRQFVDRAYPNPDDEAADAPEPAPAVNLSDKIESLIDDPRMPPGARARLAGRRPGRDTSAGIRNQTHSKVRSFVPSLLG